MSLRTRRLTLLVSGLCALAFVLLADAAEDAADARRLFAVDLATQHFVQSVDSPALDGIMRGLSWLGSGWGLAALSVLAGLLLWRRHRWWALFLPAVTAGSALLEGLSKWIVARPRPNLAAFGFPSGHVWASVVFFGGVIGFLWTLSIPRSWRWAGAGLSFVIVAGVASSRLYLNSHWLTDVLGGVTGGMAYLLFALTWLGGWRDPTRPAPSADADRRHDAAPELRIPPPSCEGLSNADPGRTVSSLRWPNRASTMLPLAREHLLTAFFMAFAVSISAVQILQTILLVLMPSWGGAGRARGVRAGGGAAMWTELAPLRRHPLTRPFLLLTALTVLSAATSGNPGWSLWIARDTLRITVFYLVLWYVRDGDHAHRLWSGFLVTLSLMAGYGLSQAWLCRVQPSAVPGAWLADICMNPDRVRGPFSIYMTFGDVLMLGALFFLAYLANVPPLPVWWMAVAALATISSLAATYARHAWLGLATGVLVLIPTSRRRVAIGLALLLVAVPGTIMAPQTIRQRIQSIVDLHDVTVRDRLAMWHSGFLMIYDHPLLGVGPGQVRAWYPAYRRPEAVRPSTGHLHSSPIHLAAERGLPALAVWAWIWVVFFREGGRIWHQLGRDRLRERALVCASLSGVAAFLASGLFQHTFGDAAVVMLVYALMALPFIVERGHSMLDQAGDSPPGAGAPRRPLNFTLEERQKPGRPAG